MADYFPCNALIFFAKLFLFPNSDPALMKKAKEDGDEVFDLQLNSLYHLVIVIKVPMVIISGNV